MNWFYPLFHVSIFSVFVIANNLMFLSIQSLQKILALFKKQQQQQHIHNCDLYNII